jgi:delta14-sterol reductase
MTWFVMDYLWHEQVHLYTYDLFAEKVGFKLVWGCLCFYPFFYPIGMLPLTSRSIEDKGVDNHHNNNHCQDVNVWSALLIALTYMVGSCLTRGANLQKYYFRRYPHQRFVSLFGGMLVLEQKTISSSRHILCSGFWGLARHINYCGEIIQAIALALPGYWCYNGPSLLLRIAPWVYPLYYVVLFFPRQNDDETLMRQKYGDKVMAEYIHQVPSRIIPGLY